MLRQFLKAGAMHRTPRLWMSWKVSEKLPKSISRENQVVDLVKGLKDELF